MRGPRPTPRLRVGQSNSRGVAAAGLRRLQQPGAVARMAESTGKSQAQIRREAQAMNRPELSPPPKRAGRKGR